jgi:hypothetical protein
LHPIAVVSGVVRPIAAVVAGSEDAMTQTMMFESARQRAIDSLKLWYVRREGEEGYLFEGTKIACNQFIREHHWQREVKKGFIRVGYIICEETP